VRALINDKGVVQPSIITSSLRPDLNDEAMKLLATWKFDPLMCNDKVAITTADLVVHFQGR
jgi:outer membrane biosynthesis protein TonB